MSLDSVRYFGDIHAGVRIDRLQLAGIARVASRSVARSAVESLTSAHCVAAW